MMKNSGLRFRLVMVVLVALAGCKVFTNKKDMDVILGSKAPDTAAGEYLNYTVGGNAGASIGYYMDKHAKKLKKNLKSGKVERIGEGILITFDEKNCFEIGSAQLSQELKENIKVLADVADDYEETEIIIEAHADSTGTSERNQELSEKRAKAVAAYATEQGLDKYRMITLAYGEDQPIANKKDKQQLNRRVDIVIIANHELKVQAKRGDIDN